MLNSQYMRKVLCCTFLMLMLFTSLSAAEFSFYDLTFFSSVEDSIAVANNERIGFDLTGYGFVGKRMTSGIYLRFGIQVPYTTLFTLFEADDSKTEAIETPIVSSQLSTLKRDLSLASTDGELSLDSGDISSNTTTTAKQNLRKDYNISLGIGPAFRHFVSDDLVWYMGMGLTNAVQNYYSLSVNESSVINTFSLKIGTDLDMGFRFDLAKRSTLRVGLHMALKLLTFTKISTIDSISNKRSEQYLLSADIFASFGSESPLTGKGYLGIAHTFKPRIIKQYRYSNRTVILGKGTKTLISKTV